MTRGGDGGGVGGGVGGGDGGMLREVCKHKSVQEIVQCEIDGRVIAASKKWFPKLSAKYPKKIEGVEEIEGGDSEKSEKEDDPRITVRVADAFQYVQTAPEGHFDVPFSLLLMRSNNFEIAPMSLCLVHPIRS